jgi:DNA-binding NarL/FixJ family response regulator
VLDGPAVDTAVIRLLVVDDESLFRQALVRLLRDERGFEVVGQADSGPESCRQAEVLQPDVVLMDLRMPGGDGVDAVRSLKRNRPEMAVLVLTSFESDAYIQEALSAGADGYLLKGSSPEALIASIRSVCAGSRTLSSAVWDRLIRLVTNFGPDSRTSYDGLTAREVQIIRLLAAGLANKQIGYRLNVSEKTVRNHICNIYEKLQINDRTQAALYAARKGLVQV